LTLSFEILFGCFVVGASWERLAADYNVLEGGLLPLGMTVLLLAPLIAGKLRGFNSMDFRTNALVVRWNPWSPRPRLNPRPLTNWWILIGDFDHAMQRKVTRVERLGSHQP